MMPILQMETGSVKGRGLFSPHRSLQIVRAEAQGSQNQLQCVLSHLTGQGLPGAAFVKNHCVGKEDIEGLYRTPIPFWCHQLLCLVEKYLYRLAVPLAGLRLNKDVIMGTKLIYIQHLQTQIP